MAASISGVGRTVEILDTEEKGSDVNLATYLIIDGYENDYEQAVVISNDSDLALPIAKVRTKLGRPVGVVNPDPKKHTTRQLAMSATFQRRIRVAALQKSQFPAVLRDSKGVIKKPSSW